MAGAPSQLELFDYKPDLMKLDGKDCPPSFLEGKKFAFIRGVPQMMGPQAQFQQVGQSGAWVSDKMPIYNLWQTIFRLSRPCTPTNLTMLLHNCYFIQVRLAWATEHGYVGNVWFGL
jgi:hypothetical protein